MLTATLLRIFVRHSYLVLFFWIYCEQMGIPLPSAPVLMAAGALCAVSCERWACTVCTVIAACVFADLLWYQIGRSYGHSLVSFIIKSPLLTKMIPINPNNAPLKDHRITLSFAKFIPGLSTLAPPLCGHSGMTRSQFLAWDLFGSALWAAFWLLSGGFLLKVAHTSSRFERIEVSTGLLLVLSLVATSGIWKLRTYVKRALGFRRLRVTPETLQRMLSLPESYLAPRLCLVDLRIPRDVLLEPRHIPTAIRIEPDCLQQGHQLIPRDRDVVFYCSCPSEATSKMWAIRLRKLGATRVQILSGGMSGWREAGYGLQDAVGEMEAT